MLDGRSRTFAWWWRRAAAITLLPVTGACADLLTGAPDDADLFDAPIGGLAASERAAFVRGDAEFARRFSPLTGLGPIFNDASCAACHSADGRGRLENALQRIGSPENDMLRAVGGPQIQTRAVPGAHARHTAARATPRAPRCLHRQSRYRSVPDAVTTPGWNGPA